MFTRDSILGCVLGGALGDVMGRPREGKPPLLRMEPDPPAGKLSDDTQLTLATCEALVERPADPECIAAAMTRWFQRGHVTGVGAATLESLQALAAGQHWRLCGRRGEYAAGNGAAMRAAPLAFVLDPALAADRDLLRDIGWITHQNDEAWAGALAVVTAVRAAATGAALDGSLLTKAAAHLPDCAVRDALRQAVSIDGVSIEAAAAQLGTSGHVVQSVPFALHAASQTGRLGFAAMLRAVVRQGGDADTTASIAGQVAGAGLGAAALPEDWLAMLHQRQLVQGIAARFADAVMARAKG